jgi:hypothetical protein
MNHSTIYSINVHADQGEPVASTDLIDASPTTPAVAPLRGAGWGILAALIANSVILIVANALLSGSVQTAQGDQAPADLPYAAVAAASVVPLLLGALALWVLARFSGSALRIWTVVVVVVTLLSLLAPASLPVDGGSKVALAAMHLLTGAAAVWGQRWAARRA